MKTAQPQLAAAVTELQGTIDRWTFRMESTLRNINPIRQQTAQTSKPLPQAVVNQDGPVPSSTPPLTPNPTHDNASFQRLQ